MNDKAFDAVESYLSESDREPSSAWRTVSLVTALLGLISRGPEFERPTPEARYSAIKAAVNELSHRGLDGVALVRYGMSREATAPVIGTLLLKALLNEGLVVDGVDAGAWSAALGLEPLQDSSGERTIQEIGIWFGEHMLPAIPRVRQWAEGASLDEIINLVPSAPGKLAEGSTDIPGVREIRDQYRWMVDHFAKTFYRDWKTSSLHYEMRWLDGDIVPPCADGIMHDRKARRRDISEEIARRAVYETGGPDAGRSIVEEMSGHALKLLRQGRYREAAAVFEFGVLQRSYDAEIRNNLGFCLIPIDPGEALEHLKAAADIGYQPTATNAYNQMCCYVSLGRPLAALNLAESEWGRGGKSQTVLLWKLSESGLWELVTSDDAVASIISFAADIARGEGRNDQEDLWRTRKERQAES